MDKRFTFVVEPFGFEVQAVAETEKQAYHLAFASLDEDVKDSVQILDCVEVEAA